MNDRSGPDEARPQLEAPHIKTMLNIANPSSGEIRVMRWRDLAAEAENAALRADVARLEDELGRVKPVVDAATALCQAWDEDRSTSGQTLREAVRALVGESGRTLKGWVTG